MISDYECPSVVALIQLYNGTAAWRIIHPMDYLHRRGARVIWGYNGEAQTAGCIDGADLVVMHRLAWKPEDFHKGLEWRRILHAAGKALIYEVDDDIITEAIVPRAMRTALTAEKTPEMVEYERKSHLFSIRLADGVICSTPRLAEICSAITDKPVLVVQNAIDLDRFRLVASVEPPREDDGTVTVGWVGGNRPDSDADALALAWRRVAQNYPSVRFLVGGYPLNVLMSSVPADRLTHLPWRGVDSYQRTYANIDVGCAPLADEPFNHAKSAIKALEYAAAGAAVCASPIVYDRLIDHGRTGLLCSTPQEWYTALSVLLDYPEQRRSMAANLMEEVERDHSLARRAMDWPKAWGTILSDFRVRALTSRRTGVYPSPRDSVSLNVSSGGTHGPGGRRAS